MNRVYEDMAGIEPIDAAEKWFARLMSPDCTLDERAAFEAWLRQAPEHALAYEETMALWAGLGGLGEDEVLATHAVSALEQDEPFSTSWAEAVGTIRRPARAEARKTHWLPWGVAVAASLLVAVFLWLHTAPPIPAVPYMTSDKIEHVQLQDGSKVQLDLGTRLTVALGPKTRDVELRQGRAMFQVAHDAARPFVVNAGAGRVTALGTQFQVQREGDAVSVTLLSGSVAIDSIRDGDDRRLLRLLPGQKADYAPATHSWTVATVDPAALTSWSQGFLVFSATPLREAVAEINRYSAVKLKLASPELGDLRLSGSFKLGDGSAIADALPYALPVKTERQAGGILVSRR